MEQSHPSPPVPPKPQIKPTPSRKPAANLERKETKENVDETATNTPIMKTVTPKPIPHERIKSSHGFSPQDLDTRTAPAAPEPSEYCVPVQVINSFKSSSQVLEVTEVLPPPIPEKTPLSQQLQISVKMKRSLPQSETFDCLSEEDIDNFGNISIVQKNTSYTKLLPLSTSLSDHNLSTDIPEPFYTELMPKMISEPSKVKPARPPPPSISALRRAQEKRRTLTLSQKNSVRLSSSVARRHTFKSTVKRNTKSSGSFAIRRPVLPTPHSNSSIYDTVDSAFNEEVDTESAHYYTAPIDPVCSSPEPVKSHRLLKSMPVSTSPALPPRAPKSNNTEKRRITANNTPKPSGFTVQLPECDTDGKKHTEKYNETKYSASKEEGDTSDFYEPVNSDKPEDCYEFVDTSIPLPPNRTKKVIKGTKKFIKGTSTNISAQTKQRARVHAEQRLSLNVRPNRENSRNAPLSRKYYTRSSSQPHSLLHTKFSLPPKGEFGSHSESVSSEEDGSSKVLGMSTEDIGGTEEYVEMEKAWEGEYEGKNIK